ncbi:hypothetical protein C8J56DRAFT_788531, partial [Mycena floridula]
REPVTTEMIQALVKDLDRSDPAQICTLFTTILTFYSHCHLGGLLHSNQNSVSFNPNHNHTFRVVKRACSSDSKIIHLPKMKRKGLRSNDTLIPKRQNDLSNLINLLNRLLKNGVRKTLTKYKMLKICNEVWEK